MTSSNYYDTVTTTSRFAQNLDISDIHDAWTNKIPVLRIQMLLILLDSLDNLV